MSDKTTGWIKIHRDIRNHWVWQKADYFKAWVYLLIKANHKSKTWLHNGNLVHIRRGELVTSLDAIAQDMNWSRSKVRHFINLLKKDTMIRTDSNTNYTHLSICNYDTYQAFVHTEGTVVDTTEGTPKAHSRQQLKNVKNEKNVKNIENRKQKFIESLIEYKDQYPSHILTQFVNYWTEANRSKTKMRFEMEKTWETGRRLGTWMRNSKDNHVYSTKVEVSKKRKLVCTNCGNTQESDQDTWKVECSGCGHNTLVTEQELRYMK